MAAIDNCLLKLMFFRKFAKVKFQQKHIASSSIVKLQRVFSCLVNSFFKIVLSSKQLRETYLVPSNVEKQLEANWLLKRNIHIKT